MYYKMVKFENLVQGAKVVGLVILAIIGAFAIAILGGIVIGVLVNTVTSGDINVSSGMTTSLGVLETSYISTISSAVTPLVTIAALVIVVVLILIFFGSKGFDMTGGRKGGGGIQ